MNKNIIILISCLIFTFCDPFGDSFNNIDDVIYYEASSMSSGQILFLSAHHKVMTWNVKFGVGRIDFWFDCYGDRIHMTTSEVEDNLQALADFIIEQEPSVILLQEIDVNSKRTAYIDQVQWLLDNTHLNYGVYASQWQNQFVPSDGLGPVDSGNAILSISPLTNAERISLPLRSDQDAITRHFYLKRNILKAYISASLTPFWVLNIHTSAFSQDGTKKKQIDRLVDELDGLNMMGETFIAGGDLNEIPPGSSQTSDFQDSICQDEDFLADDYDDETNWLDDLYANYYPAISLDNYLSDEESQFSHTTNGDGFWTRKLDYLFTNHPNGFSNSETHQNTMPLSDHAPVSADAYFFGCWDLGSYSCSEPGASIEYSCIEEGCPEGYICDSAGCYPSQCYCTEEGMICTEDCGGSVCVSE